MKNPFPFLFIILGLPGVHPKDVYVSLDQGDDTPRCGTMDSPCSTIPFTIYNIINDHDVICLDGGRQSPLIYQLNQSVSVTKSCKIIKDLRSRFGPVLTTGSTRISLIIFQDSSAALSFTFHQVDFINTSVIGSNGNINISSCSIRNSIVVFIKNEKFVSNIALRIVSSTLNNSFFFGAVHVYSPIKKMIVLSIILNNSHLQMVKMSTNASVADWITNSRFSSTDTSFRDTSIDLYRFRYGSFLGNNFQNSRILLDEGEYEFTSSTFRNSSMISDISGGFTLLIQECVFTEQHIQRLLGLYRFGYKTSPAKVVLKDTVFTRNTIRLHICLIRISVPNVEINGCEFNGNIGYSIGGTLCMIETDQVVIKNSIFRDNLSTRGGAISFYRHINAPHIINTSFYNNTARYLGGSIYSKPDRKRGALIALRLSNVTIYGSTNKKYPFVLGQAIYSDGSLDIHNMSVHVNFNAASILYSNGVQKFMSFNAYTMVCPTGYDAISIESTSKHSGGSGTRSFTSFCKPCGRGLYNLSSGEEHKINESSKMQRKNVTCSPCVSGGICDSNILSAGNFWGYRNRSNHVMFIPCPAHYCCDPHETPCTSYDTCEKNRHGKLCGKCKKGFTLNLLSSTCVSTENASLLWLVVDLCGHFVLALVYVLCLMYMKEITLFLKRPFPGRTVTIVEEDDSLIDPLIPAEYTTSSDDSEPEDSTILSVDDVTIVNRDSVEEVRTKKTVSSLIKVAFFFYQIEPLLRVNTPKKIRDKKSIPCFIQFVISSIFNIKLNDESTGIVFAPFEELNAVGKNVVKVTFIATVFLILLAMYWLHKLWQLCKNCYSNNWQRYGLSSLDEQVSELDDTVGTYSNQPLPVRMKSCAVKLSLFGYVTISNFIFQSINCVPIGLTSHLYIEGDIVCFTWWQWIMIVMAASWVLPYCFVLYLASNILSTCKVTPNEFLFILLFPPVLIMYYIRAKLFGVQSMTRANAMISKHLLADLFDTYKLTSKRKPFMWEPIAIFRKLSLVCAATFIIHPIGKLYAILALLMIYLVVHFWVQPLADRAANLVEACSIAMLCFLTSLNLFWAHVYMWNDMNVPFFEEIGQVFLFFEMIVLLLPPVFLVLFGIQKLMVKIYRAACVCM